ncbi:MAG: nucleotide exchange factor GrpE [Christensenellales bacterium]|jgi:molecular chaperone GrpE
MKKEKQAAEQAENNVKQAESAGQECACEECACKTSERAGEEESVIAELEAKCAEYLDIAQRVKADYENYRKRTQEEMKQLYFEGASCVLYDLLNIIDNFERALAVMADGPAKEGVELIKKQLDAIMQKYNVSEITALGEQFNPDLHDAVMQVEDAEQSNNVVEVLQKGYIRQGKVLRYSMVKVAK